MKLWKNWFVPTLQIPSTPNAMGRIIALDIGDRRIGIATSDPLRMIASPHSVYTRIGWSKDIKHIKALFLELEADYLLCGLPKNMDDSLGFQSEKVMQFCDMLRDHGMPIVYQDERLSTVSAHDALIEGNVSRQMRKSLVDKVAAAFILQSHLDENSQQL